MGAVNSTADTLRYRDGYPDKQDDPGAKLNIQFYRNERVSEPSGALIETILKPAELGGWFGDFELLERHHGYIQVRCFCCRRACAHRGAGGAHALEQCLCDWSVLSTMCVRDSSVSGLCAATCAPRRASECGRRCSVFTRFC